MEIKKEIIRRKVISQEVKDKITDLYSSGEVSSKQKLSEMFGMTKKRVSEILAEMGVKTISSSERRKIIPLISGDKYIPTDDYMFIAKHKETGKEFNDFKNLSGALTSYLISLNSDLVIPTKFFRKRYYEKSGDYWHEQYYNIIKSPISVNNIKKGYVSDDSISKIIDLYTGGEVASIHKLGEMFNVGNKKISQILKSANVSIKPRGGQVKENKKEKIEIKLPVVYVDSSTHTYNAVCLFDGTGFDDYNNTSGVLTRYLINKYPTIKIPSDRGKKRYFINNNKYWYEQYFDIIKTPKVELKKCSYCDFEMSLNVSARQYKMHLSMKHNMSVYEHLKLHPEDGEIFKHERNTLDKQMNPDNCVECKICGKKMFAVNAPHLKKHNITTYEYKKKYGENQSKNYTQSISQRMIELNLQGKMYNFNSASELYLKSYVSGLGFDVKSDRKVLNGKEIDILIEDKKIGIEFNGNKWHSEWFGGKDRFNHLNKTLLANEKGYGLMHIFEDEFEYKKDIVLNKIKHLLGVNNDLPKIYARKTTVKEIGRNVCGSFLDYFHIQGSPNNNSTVSLGCFFGETLVGVMCFKLIRKGGFEYDLTRFASDYNYVCVGVGSKMLQYFIKRYNPQSIISFADRRWTMNKSDNLYTKLGFKLVQELKPEYRYYNERVDRYTRFHKFGFRKQILNKKYALPLSMTETEMVKELGYDRIWDCGLFKYELKLF